MADSHDATDEQKTTLLIGFDSAWTAKNSGGASRRAPLGKWNN